MVKTRLDPQQREYAETIRACGESLLTLINNVLDFSKMEAGRLQLEAIALPLAGLVEGVIAMFTSEAEGKGIRLASELPGNLPPCVIGDPTHLTNAQEPNRRRHRGHRERQLGRTSAHKAHLQRGDQQAVMPSA